MILSSEHQFIFVHVPKTAGTSLERALSLYGDHRAKRMSRRLTRRLPLRERAERVHLRRHEPARRIRMKLGQDVYDQYESFAVVRDPFDHAVSHFECMKDFRIKSVAEKVRRMSFEQYLEYRAKPPRGNNTIFARQPNQSAYLTDESGRLLVKRVLRFETLGQDMAELAKTLGLPELRIEHLNRTRRRAITDYYTPTTEEMVRSYYGADFALFGYAPELFPNRVHMA